MILLAHMLFGAAIGSVIKNPYLAVFLALLGHYFLDFFPHHDYNISHIRLKNWSQSFPDFLKIFCDLALGVTLVYLFSRNHLIIYLCGFVALIPDGLTLISTVFENRALTIHQYIHTQKVHFLKYKKISMFWRILTQVVAVVVSLTLLLYTS